MMNLKDSLSKHLSSKTILRIMAVALLVGVADTVYLVSDYYFGTGVKCYVVEGCELVLTSSYSKIYSIPVAVFGLAFYTGMFVLANLADIYRDRVYLKLLMTGGTAGFIISLVFLYLQVFIIGALCFYCLTSLIASTTVFILSVVLYKKNNHGTT